MDINKSVKKNKPKPYMGNLTSSQIGNMVKEGLMTNTNAKDMVNNSEDGIITRKNPSS